MANPLALGPNAISAWINEDSPSPQEVEAVIRRAIYEAVDAEQERAAKIADGWITFRPGQQIATAIRRTEH